MEAGRHSSTGKGQCRPLPVLLRLGLNDVNVPCVYCTVLTRVSINSMYGWGDETPAKK